MEKRDILNELVADHWQIRDFLKELRNESTRADRKHNLLRSLGDWIRLHALGEEKTIHPYGKSHRATQILAYEDAEEHSYLLSIYRKLQHTRANPSLWAARLHLLCEFLEHHLDEEEEEYFPILRERLSPAESERLAKKYRALTEPLDPQRPRAPSGILGWLSARPSPQSLDSNLL